MASLWFAVMLSLLARFTVRFQATPTLLKAGILVNSKCLVHGDLVEDVRSVDDIPALWLVLIEDGQDRPARQWGGRLYASPIEDGRKDVHPADHRVIGMPPALLPWRRNQEREMQPRVIERGLGAWEG